jgi:Plant transposon protein
MASIQLFAFVSPSFTNPRNLKRKLFAKTQESARKAVERVFGILFKRFAILYQPSRLWSLSDMGQVVETCCILHNLIVTYRKDQYKGSAAFSLDVSETILPTDIERLVVGHEEGSVWRYWRSNVDRVESKEDQERLRDALIEHI